MILQKIKLIIFSKQLKIFYSIILFFFIIDFTFSNTIITNIVKKDCIEYSKYHLNNKNYYSYNLKKNCRAYETKKTVKTYNVFTDENGFRVSKNNKNFKKDDNLIVFLGDSFTYGFGLNYEDSVVGNLQKKNTKHQFINMGVPGYSPLILKHKLKNFIELGSRPKKIFYLLDLTDVHDESNRWVKLKNINYPVISDASVSEEIKKVFNFKKHFKMSRLLVYNLNKFFRNIRKDFKIKEFEKEDKLIGKSGWGNFTYTDASLLDKEFWKLNDFNYGIEQIKKNIKDISDISKDINSEFYIVIYPWAETLEYGEESFSWQNFSQELCDFTTCTKLINAFPSFMKVKNSYAYWKKEIYFLQDIHFNAKGNKMLAEVIYSEAIK